MEEMFVALTSIRSYFLDQDDKFLPLTIAIFTTLLLLIVSKMIFMICARENDYYDKQENNIKDE